MAEKRIVKLHFKSAIHLGSDVTGIGVEESQLIAHSDTLFSCLINAYAQLHSTNISAVKDLFARFREGEPPFRLSSVFPFERQTEHRTTYYLPKPLIDPPQFYDTSEGQWFKNEYGKVVNNTQLVGMDNRNNNFQNWLKGIDVDLDALENQNIESVCVSNIRPQHERDRLTDATSIYHTGLVHFHRESGLYFLVELNDESALDWDMFRTILTQAGINGLGGRRSHGNGIFKVTDDTISELDSVWNDLFNLPEQNGYINLSLYLPETFDNLNPAAYHLVPRRGWCYSSVTPIQMKRQAVTMFREGSVFSNELKGTLADVTPKKSKQSPGFTAHKVYRYGIPIALPIKILEEENDVS